MGFFDFFRSKSKNKDRIAKPDPTKKNSFWQSLKSLFHRKPTLDDALLDEIESLLFTADMGLETTDRLIQALQKHAGQALDLEQAIQILKREIITCLTPIATTQVTTEPKPMAPQVVLVVGVNGVGKTTTIGKLAYLLQEEGQKVMIGAADTFRAAAVEQLQRWGEQLQVPVISHGMHKDPGAVAYDALSKAREQQIDTLIIDTAGRLHNKVNLMNELAKVKRVLQKQDPAAPHEILLVLDGSTGQNACQQAALFHEKLNVTGLTVTKLDGVAKGGFIVGIATTLGIPIRYIGLGEKAGDLQRFDAEVFAEQLLQI